MHLYIKGFSDAISRVSAPLNICTVSKATNIKWTLMKKAQE